MRRDSQQSIDSSSWSQKNRRLLKGAALGLAAIGAIAVGQVESRPSDSAKPELAFMDPAFAANFLRYNPQTAFADALWKCWTTFTANVHASKERPDQDVRGVVLEVSNKTNPSDVKRLVTVDQSHYRQDKKYPNNTVVEGTNDHVANIYGNPTTENHCPKDVIKCDQTTLVIKEVGGRGQATEVQAECPNSGNKGEPCDKWVSWSVEQGPKVPVATPELIPVQPTPAPTCPEGTTTVSMEPLICERIVIVPENPPIQQ